MLLKCQHLAGLIWWRKGVGWELTGIHIQKKLSVLNSKQGLIASFDFSFERKPREKLPGSTSGYFKIYFIFICCIFVN